MSRPIFFVRRGDRLIARLKHLFHAWRFAREAGGLVIMHWSDEMPEYWQKYDGAMYSASLIFDLQAFYAAGGSDSLVFMGERIGNAAPRWEGATLSGPAYASMRFNKFSRDAFRQDGLVFYESAVMRYQFEDERKTNEQIQRELGSLFDRLPPTPYLARAIDQTRAKLGQEGYVGVHVRRGDVYDRLREELPGLSDGTLTADRFEYLIGHYVARTAPQELYEPAFERALSEGRRVAFFSDSPESIAGFQKRFGTSSVIDMSKVRLRLPIQKAYLDFVMLKGSDRIVSTRSNYASFGAQLSGVEHTIVSSDDTTNLAVDDVVELYTETAIREFLPKGGSSPALASRLRDEILKAYLEVNQARTAGPRSPLPPAPRAAAVTEPATTEPAPKDVEADDVDPEIDPAASRPSLLSRLGWKSRSAAS